MALYLVRTLGWLFVIAGALLVPLGIAWISHFNGLSLVNLMPTLGYSAFLLAIGAFLLLFIRPDKTIPPSAGGSA